MPLKKKAIKRRAWTPGDVKEFRSLAKAKTPAAKIARRFNRTEGAVRQKALGLGISLNARGTSRKTKSHVSDKAVLGVTSDGVRILKPRPATNFSQKEIREAILTVQSGRN
jgi:hypothetical protein